MKIILISLSLVVLQSCGSVNYNGPPIEFTTAYGSITLFPDKGGKEPVSYQK